MSAWNPTQFTGRHIVVADQDPSMVAMIIKALRADGHAVFHATGPWTGARFGSILSGSHSAPRPSSAGLVN